MPFRIPNILIRNRWPVLVKNPRPCSTRLHARVEFKFNCFPGMDPEVIGPRDQRQENCVRKREVELKRLVVDRRQLTHRGAGILRIAEILAVIGNGRVFAPTRHHIIRRQLSPVRWRSLVVRHAVLQLEDVRQLVRLLDAFYQITRSRPRCRAAIAMVKLHQTAVDGSSGVRRVDVLANQHIERVHVHGRRLDHGSATTRSTGRRTLGRGRRPAARGRRRRRRARCRCGLVRFVAVPTTEKDRARHTGKRSTRSTQQRAPWNALLVQSRPIALFVRHPVPSSRSCMHDQLRCTT